MLTQSVSPKTAVRTHQRFVISGQTKPYHLESITEPIPEPAAGQVRVRVLAAGVAFADVLARKGMYPGAPRNPFTPGYDIVGIIDKIGSNVNDLTIGQIVAAILPKFGGYAEAVCLPARLAVPVPDGVEPVRAVSVILNYLTAYRMLHIN
ncbi:MAG: alcohol dehydrogenase catalytic domain-containing protein, partial [Anaerolineae bacterium]